MQITVKACGIEAELSLTNFEDGIQVVASKDCLADMSFISLDELKDSGTPILHEKIYHAVKRLAGDIEIYRSNS